MEKALIKPKEWELSKKSLAVMGDALIESEPDPLRVAITLKAMGEFIDYLKEKIKQPVMDAIKKADANKVHLGNYSITLAQKSSFDYSECKLWRETTDTIKAIRQKHTDAMNAELSVHNTELKRVQDLMKITVAVMKDPVTGKLIQPVKKIPGTAYFSVSIPNE